MLIPSCCFAAYMSIQMPSSSLQALVTLEDNGQAVIDVAESRKVELRKVITAKEQGQVTLTIHNSTSVSQDVKIRTNCSCSSSTKAFTLMAGGSEKLDLTFTVNTSDFETVNSVYVSTSEKESYVRIRIINDWLKNKIYLSTSRLHYDGALPQTKYVQVKVPKSRDCNRDDDLSVVFKHPVKFEHRIDKIQDETSYTLYLVTVVLKSQLNSSEMVIQAAETQETIPITGSMSSLQEP
jgi:hypothetical protein